LNAWKDKFGNRSKSTFYETWVGSPIKACIEAKYSDSKLEAKAEESNSSTPYKIEKGVTAITKPNF
jgi:hypothetical protein